MTTTYIGCGSSLKESYPPNFKRKIDKKMSDKRKVTTDALETLGTIIEDGGRDAIHLAVEPVVAGEVLYPGQHIGIRDGKALGVRDGVKALGIVDPFLTGRINPDQKFWLVVFPRQITSLRHVWSHPDFHEATEKNTDHNDPVEISKAWITAFAVEIDQTYHRLMKAADDWFYHNEYTYDNNESYKEHWDKFPEFWDHYKVVTGREPSEKESFFTCSC